MSTQPGINHESSFEAELLANTEHCQVWGYDFSVDSFGPQISRSLAPRTHFFPYGLAGQDHIPGAHASPEDHPMYTLQSLMRMNGHTHIDILKVDIESWEFETLTSLIKPYLDTGKPLPFGQLQLEIHLWNKEFPEFLEWWEMLEAAGLRPFMTEPNLVYVNYNRQAGADLAEVSTVFIQMSHNLESFGDALERMPTSFPFFTYKYTDLIPFFSTVLVPQHQG